MSHYSCKKCWQYYEDCVCGERALEMVALTQRIPPEGPRITGYSPTVVKKFTCSNCGAIVEYKPIHEEYTGHTDEGTKIKGLDCPGCGQFHRTNP